MYTMNYEIEAGKHSADKDHRVMTWGTLSVDKTVRAIDGVTFHTYSIALYCDMILDTDFHKWIHTLEHMIAYKKDTGSVRNSLEEVTGWLLSWKVILDISPYKTSPKSFGFRITSMIALEVQMVQELVKLSLDRALEFLKTGVAENPNDYQAIPFARPESCGQYDFHNTQRAIADLEQIQQGRYDIQEQQFHTQDTTAYICDLRFLKPKIANGDSQVMLSPQFSYRISELIETYLPKELSGSIALVWTFGCMTGMYLCISSPIGDTTDIAHIHATIIQILLTHIERSTLTHTEQIQFDTLLRNYDMYGTKM